MEKNTFFTPFELLGFSRFGTDKPNILATTGIKNAKRKTLMQAKMRHNQRTIEA
ncbi:hypothetical protein [Aliivibrio sp. SR45-2]|uniref:hypothetical protein n=1 Tax=Aliivibrio sp. SR45-2 TaxID=2760931 RepID=UPI002102797B|nr:hypothetical protein [Aliivibrio sp. SR45-2]